MKTAADYRSEGFGKEFPWLDLINSQEWDGFGVEIDHLEDSAWFPLFLRHWKLARRGPGWVPHTEIVKLRGLLRNAAERWAAGEPMGAREMAALNSVLSVAAEQKLVQGQNGFRLEFVPRRMDWRWILSRIVASFAQTLISAAPERLKFCRNAGCKWSFYDTTKGNTRCWCKDSSCGNRDRVRRARAAQR
jgi:predicted RNA-binding Zn ribbon-like protein